MTIAPRLLAALGNAGPILLDFDGPVTPLLPPPANARVAVDARKPLTAAGVAVPAHVAETTDHLMVLRFASHLPLHIARAVEFVCIAAEVQAARTSTPTRGAHEAIRALRKSDRPIVIVTNNATAAVDVYLERHSMTSLIAAVVGRPFGQPDLMKPHPRLVSTALGLLDTDGPSCVLIGDSVTDVQAARQATARCIGYAKTGTRGEELSDAGADAVISDMHDLVDALQPAALPN